MSFVIATPDLVGAAATDLASIGSTLNVANTAAAAQTTAVVAAAGDEVPVAMAGCWSAPPAAEAAAATAPPPQPPPAPRLTRALAVRAAPVIQAAPAAPAGYCSAPTGSPGELLLHAAVDGDRRPADRRGVMDSQIRFGVTRRDASAGELRRYDVAGALAPIM